MSSAKTFYSSPSCCIMQKASPWDRACDFFYGLLFCLSLQVWCWPRASLAFTRVSPGQAREASSPQQLASAVLWKDAMATAGDGGIGTAFPNSGLVSIDWTLLMSSKKPAVVRQAMGRFLCKALRSKLRKTPLVWLNFCVLWPVCEKCFLKSFNRFVCVVPSTIFFLI